MIAWRPREGAQLIVATKACIYTFMDDLSACELELCTKVSTVCACKPAAADSARDHAAL